MAAKNINVTANMAFGRFVATSGGTISIGTNSARTRIGGVILLSSSASAAAFALDGSGNSNKIATLTLPANGSVTLTSGTHQMALNNFVTNFASGGVLPPAGTNASVGATLSVAPNQAPGTYSGTFHVTIDFQ